MDITDINTLLQVGERISFECKKCENQIPKSVWETYSSFANTVGGIIVLGITERMEEPDQAKRFEITGVNNPTKLKKGVLRYLEQQQSKPKYPYRRRC